MRSLINNIKSFFSSNHVPADSPDLEEIMAEIKTQSDKTETGRRIHQFHYLGLDICLDLDITKTYRITVFQGKERIYSFSVYCEKANDEKLLAAYERIISFLEGNRNLKNLPDNELMKGFYYGGG